MADPAAPLCPSYDPGLGPSHVIGVAAGPGDRLGVTYLDRPVPATAEILALAAPATPTEVFRFAGPCAGEGCRHFGKGRCGIAAAVVARLDGADERLPRCGIRPRCRWFRQEGPATCRRCAAVVTLSRCEAMAGVLAGATPPDFPATEETQP